MLDAIQRSRPHLVYVSIVGVDRHRFRYYNAKWEAEQIVESCTVPWTIQRATQFHDLLDLFLSYPLVIETSNLAFVVVDAGEVAARLADLVEAGPQGRAGDFGGREVLGIRELAATRREITGKRSRLVRVPRVGPIRDFDRGLHRCREHRGGHLTRAEWLAARGDPPQGRRVTPPASCQFG